MGKLHLVGTNEPVDQSSLTLTLYITGEHRASSLPRDSSIFGLVNPRTVMEGLAYTSVRRPGPPVTVLISHEYKINLDKFSAYIIITTEVNTVCNIIDNCPI